MKAVDLLQRYHIKCRFYTQYFIKTATLKALFCFFWLKMFQNSNAFRVGVRVLLIFFLNDEIDHAKGDTAKN